MVSHSILVFLTKRERLWFSPLITISYELPQRNKHWKEDQSFLKQSEVDSDSHKQVHHTFMRKPEFCSNQQA